MNIDTKMEIKEWIADAKERDVEFTGSALERRAQRIMTILIIDESDL